MLGYKRKPLGRWGLVLGLVVLLFSANAGAMQPPSLHEAYADQFLIGFAARAAYYMDDFINLTHFNAVTAENAMKWESLQPYPGTFDFYAADNLVDYAEKQDRKSVV